MAAGSPIVSGDDEPIPPAPALDESTYISDEEDTLEKVKRGFKKFGSELKKSADEIAEGTKKLASKSKEKFDSKMEARREAKSMKDPSYPWGQHTVKDLKERLKNLELAVSGKKDDLVERISRYYRTEIPSQDDGSPELIDNLESVESEDIPPAPELYEEEAIPEPHPQPQPDLEVEEVAAGTPLYRAEDGEQLFVPDPIRTNKVTGSWKANRVNSTISSIFGVVMLLYTLSIIDYVFDVGLFSGTMEILNSLAAKRLVHPYGGMDEVQTMALSGLLAFLFFFSSLLFFSRKRPIKAALVAMFALLASFSIRIFAAIEVNAFEEVDIIGVLIFDLVTIIPFTIGCWVPAMARSVLYSNDVVTTDFVTFQSEQSVSSEPESITDTGYDEYVGEDMGAFSVSRPNPPKRRQKLSYSLYEFLFLAISLCIWPFTIGMHIVMALGITVEWVSYTGDLDSHGITLLVPLYILCGICTIAVVRFDKEARAGEVYAKEKLAYHRDMDQYLDLKKAYYEKKAEELGALSSNDDE